MMINKSKFYSAYRLQFGALKSQSTVDNLSLMLDMMEKHQDLFDAKAIEAQLAYLAATVKHETGGTFAAEKEKRQSVSNNMTARQKQVRQWQDRYWGSGYYGRGVIQLTWRNNYDTFQKLTGKPLLNEPNLLLTDLALSYEVAIKGMCLGLFTSKSLDDYIKYMEHDFINARRIVNGVDAAQQIAKDAEKFLTVFRSCVSN